MGPCADDARLDVFSPEFGDFDEPDDYRRAAVALGRVCGSTLPSLWDLERKLRIEEGLAAEGSEAEDAPDPSDSGGTTGPRSPIMHADPNNKK